MFGLVAGGCSSFSNLLELTDLFSIKKKKKNRSFVYSTFALLMNLFNHNNFPLALYQTNSSPHPPKKNKNKNRTKCTILRSMIIIQNMRTLEYS